MGPRREEETCCADKVASRIWHREEVNTFHQNWRKELGVGRPEVALYGGRTNTT